MTNRYYNSSFVAAPNSLIRSQSHLQQYASVADGFAAVETEMDTKADANSPTIFDAVLTGDVDASTALTVAVPTVSLSATDLSLAASIGYVIAAIGASGSMLPPQTGHSGKALKSDGASASWQLVLPAQSTKSGKVLQSTGVDGAEAWVTLNPITGAGVTNVSSPTTLTGRGQVINFTAATYGLTATLPDARTLLPGDTFPIAGYNSSQGICSADGELIHSQGSTGNMLVLDSNATLAGTWKAFSFGSSMYATSAAQIAGAQVTLRASRDSAAAAQIDATRFLFCCGSASSGLGVDIFIATVDTTALSVSAGSVTTVGTDQVRWCKLLAVTGGWIFVYHDSTGAIKGVGITVSGSTITAGAVTTLMSSMVTAGTNYTDAASSGATAVVVSMKSAATTCAAVAMQLSGTTIMLGAEATVASSITDAQSRLVAVSATQFMWAAYVTETGPVYALRARNLSISGVTITAGTSTTSTTFTNATFHAFSAAAIDATSMLLAHSTNQDFRVLVVSAVTTTPVFNSPLTYATGATPYFCHLEKCGSYHAIAWNSNSAGYVYQLSVSGATVSQVGSAAAGMGAGFVSNSTQAAPVWDGTYLNVPTNSSTVILESIGVSGPSGALTFTASIAASSQTANAYTNGRQQVWALTGKIRFAYSDSSSIAARVYRYGGIT